jgi:short-subunit dehydrogenase
MSRARGPSGDATSAVVVVTGASRGIGYEVCRRFSEAGAAVGMIARDAEALDAARRSLSGRNHAVAADVSVRDEVDAAVVEITEVLGAPSVLVNNAGHGQWGAVVDTAVAEHRRALDVNYMGAVHAIGAVLPGMLRRRRGRIVNVASIAGRIGAPFEAAYSASKFALVGYSEALAIELAGTGVSVALVSPGPVATSFHDRRGHAYDRRFPRPLSPERVATAVVTAATRERSEQFLPRWLRAAQVMKTMAPAVYRVGTSRLYAGERQALAERYR